MIACEKRLLGSMDRIIFEDEELRVIWTPRGSECLIITFGDLMHLANGMDYFAKVPLDKLGYSSLGFMNKHSHWFPAANMHRAMAAVAAILQKHPHKVIYGGSMGGYAAIKYSRLLQATQVLAMCPQSGIDAQQCPGWDPGWQTYFVPSMQGMGITASDIGGQVYLICDFHHRLDKQHADQIAAVSAQVHLINMPCTQHHVTTVMAGSRNLEALIQACRRGSLIDLQRISRHARRHSDIYKKNVLKIAHRKLPRWFVRYLSCKENRYLFKVKPVFGLYYLRHVLRSALPF